MVTLIRKFGLFITLFCFFWPILLNNKRKTSENCCLSGIKCTSTVQVTKVSVNSTWRKICAPHFLEWLQFSNSERIGELTSGFPFQYARGHFLVQFFFWEPRLMSLNSSSHGFRFVSGLYKKFYTPSKQWVLIKTHIDYQIPAPVDKDHFQVV